MEFAFVLSILECLRHPFGIGGRPASLSFLGSSAKQCSREPNIRYTGWLSAEETAPAAYKDHGGKWYSVTWLLALLFARTDHQSRHLERYFPTGGWTFATILYQLVFADEY